MRNFSVLIKIMGPEASPLLTYVCIVIFMAINKVYQKIKLTFPSWLLKTKHIGIMPKCKWSLKTKKLVTASFIKRFHSWITSRSTDFFLSSSHDFLQFRAAAAILKSKHGSDKMVTALCRLRGTVSNSSG